MSTTTPNAPMTEMPVTAPPTDGVGPSGPTIRIATDDAPTCLGRADPETPIVVELQDLSCFYGDFRAVRNIDLTVRKQRDHGPHRTVRAAASRRCCARSTA